MLFKSGLLFIFFHICFMRKCTYIVASPSFPARFILKIKVYNRNACVFNNTNGYFYFDWYNDKVRIAKVTTPA